MMLDSRLRERQVWQTFQELAQEIRWVMVGLFVAMAVFFQLPLATWRMQAITGLLLVGLGVMAPMIIHTMKKQKSLGMLRSWVVVGLLIHTSLIALTGGFDSPFFPLFMILPVFAGGLWRELRLAMMVPMGSTICIALLGICHGLGWLPAMSVLSPPTIHLAALFGKGLVMVLICFVATFLVVRFASLYERAAQCLWQTQSSLLELHKERLRSLESLSRRMAHEVNNPLSSIKGLTQLLLRRGDTTGHLQVIESEVVRLQGIIREFLSFSPDAQILQLQPLDLRSLLDDIAMVLGLRMTQANIALVYEKLPSQMWLQGDPGQLMQLLLNLLLNAIEAMELALPGAQMGTTQNRQIVVEASLVDGGFALRIVDQGPGFRAHWGASELARLCQPTVSSKPDGTGLGLAICASIVKAHGGTLALSDKAGKERGGVVSLWLPIGSHAEREPDSLSLTEGTSQQPPRDG